MADEARVNQGYSLGQKLWWLILGRLIAALALLLVGTLWVHKASTQQSWSKSFPILVAVIGLTVLYSLLRRLSRKFLLQARIQLLVDVLLVTWLVWTSDVIHSPYTALYIVIIAASSLFLDPRDAVITSVGCAVAFTGCALAVLSGFGNHPSRELLEASLSQTVQSIGLFDIAFLVVGLLSARLAERQSRSDVRLMAATQSLATLRALHERIVESIRSGLVTTDLKRRIYTFNATAREITGYEEEVIRGKDASILFGEMKERIDESLR